MLSNICNVITNRAKVEGMYNYSFLIWMHVVSHGSTMLRPESNEYLVFKQCSTMLMYAFPHLNLHHLK